MAASLFETVFSRPSLGMLLVSAMLCASCSQTNADKIGDAQLCIDKATQGTASSCLNDISGIDTPAAYLLRCSAGFIDEGFTQPTRFNSAFQALSESGGNSIETFLSVLAFSSQPTAAENQSNAQTTYNNCIASQSKGYMLLAAMAQTATTLSILAGELANTTFVNGTQPTASQITNAIGANYTDPTTQTAVGTAVLATYQSSCETGSQANATLCSQMSTAMNSGAVDTSNPQSVGQAVLTYWYENP